MDAVTSDMVEACGRTVQAFGLNRLLGQIYALLYMRPDPLCLDDIADALMVSKASVSIACRQLAGWGAVHHVWQRGDRKDYYTAESDFKALLNNGVLESIRKKLDSAETLFQANLKRIDASSQTTIDPAFTRKRLKEAEKTRARIRRLIDNPLVRRVL
jgi:DNA-binding transcriptional regulator GbsR (MarR family)